MKTKTATLTIVDEQDSAEVIGEVEITHYADEAATDGWVTDPDRLEEVCARQPDGRGIRYFVGEEQVSIDEDGALCPVE